MVNKYYTPEIEEFHVGFEYEWFDGSDWNKVTQKYFDGGLFNNGDGEHPFEYQLSDVGIRVKYLDQEDIESLGFNKITDNCFNLSLKSFRGRLNKELRIVHTEFTLIYLAREINDKDTVVLFPGTIPHAKFAFAAAIDVGDAVKF